MPKCLDISTWRPATRDELLEIVEGYKNRTAKKGSSLIVRSSMKPVDVYAYLRVRFGQPNGIQNFFRSDDSDNWIHWHYSLRANDVIVEMSGTSRDVHMIVSEELSDSDWRRLLASLKSDFSRIGRDKSAMIRSFEKFVVFQNKYHALASLCADMHATIVDTPDAKMDLPVLGNDDDVKAWERNLDTLRERATSLYGDCLKLRLLTPIMAEAFLNMLILAFCKDAIRNDQLLYETFIRAKIPERLDLLYYNCDGFTRRVDPRSDAYRDFMRVMNARNFAIHGNVDPIKEQIEIVYFEGKRPLFAESGDHTLKLFQQLESINRPREVVKDYEATHAFLHEITTCLSPSHSKFFEHVMNDPYPGFEVHKQRVNKILPNHNVAGFFTGIRYDDELSYE